MWALCYSIWNIVFLYGKLHWQLSLIQFDLYFPDVEIIIFFGRVYIRYLFWKKSKNALTSIKQYEKLL